MYILFLYGCNKIVPKIILVTLDQDVIDNQMKGSKLLFNSAIDDTEGEITCPYEIFDLRDMCDQLSVYQLSKEKFNELYGEDDVSCSDQHYACEVLINTNTIDFRDIIGSLNII